MGMQINFELEVFKDFTFIVKQEAKFSLFQDYLNFVRFLKKNRMLAAHYMAHRLCRSAPTCPRLF